MMAPEHDPSTSPASHTARLAAALAPDHLHLHGPFVVHLARRVVKALWHDPAALARLTESVEALAIEPRGCYGEACACHTAPPRPYVDDLPIALVPAQREGEA